MCCEYVEIGKNRSMNKGVHKSIPFFDFFFLSKLVFSKKGLSKFNKYVYYFFSFWERKMKLLKEMKDVLIASGILLSIMIGLLIFTQVYF